MASWTSLPITVKKMIIKKLDLLTRCRLKISSRSNQELVNSMPLTIKNARIGLGDDACLLIVYTGIGKFVRLDLEKIGGKVVIKRLINSRKVSKAKKIPTDHKDLFVPLCRFIKSLLTSASYNITLNTLELECNPLKNEEATVEKMKKRLDGVQFLAKKLMNHSETAMSKFLSSLCRKKNLERTERLTVYLAPQSPFPTRVLKIFCPKHLDAKLTADHCASYVFHDRFLDAYHIEENAKFCLQKVPGAYAMEQIRFIDPVDNFNQVQAQIQRVSDKIIVKRVCSEQLVYRHTLTGCGYSLFVIHESKENTIDFTLDPCGLGMLCLKCADPFERTYFNDISRRVLYEPKWLNVFKNDVEDIRAHANMLRENQSVEEILLTIDMMEKREQIRKAKKAQKKAAAKKEKAHKKHINKNLINILVTAPFQSQSFSTS